MKARKHKQISDHIRYYNDADILSVVLDISCPFLHVPLGGIYYLIFQNKRMLEGQKAVRDSRDGLATWKISGMFILP